MVHIIQVPIDEAPEWAEPDRSFVVESEIELFFVGDQVSYNVIPVEPYTKTYGQQQHIGTGVELFVAYFQNQVAGEIRLSRSWNGYAYIDNFIVGRDFRRLGIAKALLRKAFAWSQSNNLPGIALETQNNNLPACRLYESCGFQLGGFDSNLYRGLNPDTREVALFWYWHRT